MSVCGHDCGCTTPCDNPVTMEELLDLWYDDEDDVIWDREDDVPVADLIQRVKERRQGL